jgi:AcrR family transcriptional regulator
MARVRRHEIKKFTRERLRLAARGEFANRGVAAASVDRISEGAGFSRGAFYSNYPNKRELLLEIIVEDNEREIALWQDIIDSSANIDDTFSVISDRFNQYAEKRESWMLGAELQLEAERDPEFGKTYRVHAERVLAKVVDLLTSLASKSGGGGGLDIGVGAVAMRSLCQGLMFANTNGAQLAGQTPGEAVTRFLRGFIEPRQHDQTMNEGKVDNGNADSGNDAAR